MTLGWGLHMLAQWLVDLILGENSPAVFTLPILTTTCMKLNMEPVASWLTIFPSGNDNFWVPYGYMMYSSAPDVCAYMGLGMLDIQEGVMPWNIQNCSLLQAT